MKVSKAIFWIFATAIGFRIVLWLFQVEPGLGDGWRYLKEGVNLIENHTFSQNPIVYSGAHCEPTAFDLPLYPAVLAGFYWITRSIVLTQRLAGLFNIVLVLATGLVLLRTLRGRPFCANDRQCCIALIVLFFMPEALAYSLFHMPDQLHVFFLVLGMFFYFRGSYLSGRNFIFAAVVFGLGIYTKPVCLPFAAAMIVGTLLVARGTVFKRLLIALSMCAVIVMMLLPWVERNRRAFGTPGVATILGINPFGFNLRDFIAAQPDDCRCKMEQARSEFLESIRALDEMKQSQEKGRYAREVLTANLPEYLLFVLKRHPHLYYDSGIPDLFEYVGANRLFDAWYATKHRKPDVKIERMYPDPRTGLLSFTTDKPMFNGWHRVAAIGLMLIASCGLLIFYTVIAWGCWRIIKEKIIKLFAQRECREALIYLCPLLCICLFAIVIGPITNARYRCVMVPFFALLSIWSVQDREST